MVGAKSRHANTIRISTIRKYSIGKKITMHRSLFFVDQIDKLARKIFIIIHVVELYPKFVYALIHHRSMEDRTFEICCFRIEQIVYRLVLRTTEPFLRF